MTYEELSDLLRQSTMTLATCDMEGNPHAAPLYFAADKDLSCYFLSKEDSQHGQDLATHPQAAVAIFIEASDWREIRGLQMRGRAQIVTEPRTRERGWTLYRQKFPFVAELAQIVQTHQLYVFIPEWARYINNRLALGSKKEWRIP
ncbi:MAG: pyridoxamine 5'-phosphate oxidase family protein [Chloroflexota bacterium]